MPVPDEVASSHQAVLAAVQRIVVRESRLSIDPAGLAGDEPLDGRLLRVTSFGLLGMLVRLEDELSITLPDDLFVGRVIRTVADLAALIESACAGDEETRSAGASAPGRPAP